MLGPGHHTGCIFGQVIQNQGTHGLPIAAAIFEFEHAFRQLTQRAGNASGAEKAHAFKFQRFSKRLMPADRHHPIAHQKLVIVVIMCGLITGFDGKQTGVAHQPGIPDLGHLETAIAQGNTHLGEKIGVLLEKCQKPGEFQRGSGVIVELRVLATIFRQIEHRMGQLVSGFFVGHRECRRSGDKAAHTVFETRIIGQRINATARHQAAGFHTLQVR